MRIGCSALVSAIVWEPSVSLPVDCCMAYVTIAHEQRLSLMTAVALHQIEIVPKDQENQPAHHVLIPTHTYRLRHAIKEAGRSALQAEEMGLLKVSQSSVKQQAHVIP